MIKWVANWLTKNHDKRRQKTIKNILQNYSMDLDPNSVIGQEHLDQIVIDISNGNETVFMLNGRWVSVRLENNNIVVRNHYDE